MKTEEEKRNIFLIGPRAAGKSVTAKNIHQKLGYNTLSTDVLISYECDGKTIPEIIKDENGSWKKFRDLEYLVLTKVSKMSKLVIDTGGGIIVDLDSDGREIFSKRKRKIIKDSGYTIYLKADLEWLWEKVKTDSNRPGLSGNNTDDDRSSFIKIMSRRLPWYEETSDFIIDATQKDEKILANDVLKQLSNK